MANGRPSGEELEIARRMTGADPKRAKMFARGGLAELADADGSKSSDRKVMGVQVPRPLPLSERSSQVESEWNRHPRVLREQIAVGIMRDPDFSGNPSVPPQQDSRAHEILKRERPPGRLSVNAGPGDQGRPGQGVTEIQFHRIRANRDEP
jgi:hypothetical protein